MQRNYHQLECYQRSVLLASEVLKISKKIHLPRLVDQISASSLSISSNIAEGSTYKSGKQYAHFLSIAQGSCAELETQLQILSLSFPELTAQTSLLREEALCIQRMIRSLRLQVLKW